MILVASNAGSTRHPSWYHNVRANPAVTFLRRGGHSASYVAREAAGPERAELWDRVNDLYGGYDTYQGRTGGREIPVVVLDPAEGIEAQRAGMVGLRTRIAQPVRDVRAGAGSLVVPSESSSGLPFSSLYSTLSWLAVTVTSA